MSQGAAYQLQSRDVYRVSKLLPLERRASLFFSVFSFYVANAITMYVVHITTVLYALLAVSNLLTTYTGMTTDLRVLGAHYPLLFMIVLTLPDIILVCFEEGLRGGFRFFAGKVVTLGPFYYIFLAQTRAFHMTNALRWGKAAYFKTKRTLAVLHQPFHELFMAYSRSHLNQGVESFLMLMIAQHVNAPSDFGIRVWMFVLICVALVATPFLYNPLVLDPKLLYRDMIVWNRWVSKGGLDGKGTNSYSAWWESVTPTPQEHGIVAMVGALAMAVLYLQIATGLLPYINRTVPLTVVAQQAATTTTTTTTTVSSVVDTTAAFNQTFLPISLGIAVILPSLILAVYDTHASIYLPMTKPWLRPLIILTLASMSIVYYGLVATYLGEYILGEKNPHFHESVNETWWRLWHSIPVAMWHALYIQLLLAALGYFLDAFQVFVPPVRYVLRLLQRARDYMLFGLLYFWLVSGSILYLPRLLQSKVLFQPHAFFFSRTSRGLCLAVFYVLFYFVLLMTFLVYTMLGKAIGIVPVASLDPFQCS